MTNSGNRKITSCAVANTVRGATRLLLLFTTTFLVLIFEYVTVGVQGVGESRFIHRGHQEGPADPLTKYTLGPRIIE